MSKKTMEEFVKENGTYDEKEDSYSFSCSQADAVKEDVDFSHEAFVSSVDLATKASDMYSRGCSMEEIHDFIIENMPGELPKEAHEELKSILSQFY